MTEDDLIPQIPYTQPKLFCPVCHTEIPDNVDVLLHPEAAGKRSGLIACVVCAVKAGGKGRRKYPPAKGRELEKYGQKTVADVCGSIPMLRIE